MPSYPVFERVRRPVMFQEWREISFIHWRYPVELIAARLPAAMAVDTCNGSAWVGLTPFILRGLRPPFLPALPWISHFPETNLRTYVIGPDGKPGIWFFSLDAGRLAAVAGARATYGLPYAWAKMRVEGGAGCIRYTSRRRWPDVSAATFVEVEHGGAAENTALEIFLTARFRLYSLLRRALVAADVDHEPWPLERARLVKLEQTLTDAAGLPRPGEPDLVHFSTGVETRIAAPRPVAAVRSRGGT